MPPRGIPRTRGSAWATACAAVVALFALLALDSSANQRGSVQGTGVQGKPTLLKAKLDGSKVVPGPGDPDARGVADVSARPGELKICLKLKYELGTEAPTKVQLHNGSPDEAGPSIATFLEDADGGYPGPTLLIGCEGKMPKALVRRVAKHPKDFYLDFQTLAHPDGAMRGQLTR